MNSSKPTGRFTRYINEEEKVYKNGRLKPRAFYPTKEEKDHISVFFIEKLNEADIWNIGIGRILPQLLGRADFNGACVTDIGLYIKIDNIPPGHASLGPFPDLTSVSNEREKRRLTDIRSQIGAALAYISTDFKRYVP